MTDIAPACGTGLPAAFLSSLGALKGQRVLVTGGAGFLGGHIVSVLLQAGAKVRVFDVIEPRENHGAWKKEDKVEVVVGECNRAAVQSRYRERSRESTQREEIFFAFFVSPFLSLIHFSFCLLFVCVCALSR